MEAVFVDSDIVMDLLTGRLPHHQHAASLFSLADQGIVSLYVSSLTFANVHYIISQQLSAQQARKILLTFKTLVKVLSVNDKILELALSSDFRDFEDAIQYHTAVEHKIETLLTRNLKDYKKANITIMTAQQFVTTLE